MHRELHWPPLLLALLMGLCGARLYTRLAIPYYAIVARTLCLMHPWQVDGLTVITRDGAGPVLALSGSVRAHPADRQPAARLISMLQLTTVVESPLLFWGVLLVWPLPAWRQRGRLLLVALPLFLALEALTTVCQLLGPLAYASAAIAGVAEPVTLWELWSRFLEDGGRVVLALCAALGAVALASGCSPLTRPVAPPLAADKVR